MYYITNQNNYIIAIAPALLALLKAESIDALYQKLALEEIIFSSATDENQEVTIATAQIKKHYSAKSSTLSSIFGEVTLVQLQPFPETAVKPDEGREALTETKPPLPEEKKESTDTLLSDDLASPETINNITEETHDSLLDKLPEESSPESQTVGISSLAKEEVLLESDADEFDLSLLDDNLAIGSDKTEPLSTIEEKEKPAPATITPESQEEKLSELELDLDKIFEEASKEEEPLLEAKIETKTVESSDDFLTLDTPDMQPELKSAEGSSEAVAPIDDEILGLSDADIDNSLAIKTAEKEVLEEEKEALFDLDLSDMIEEAPQEPIVKATPSKEKEELFDLDLDLMETPKELEPQTAPEPIASEVEPDEVLFELELEPTQTVKESAEEKRDDEHLNLLIPDKAKETIEKIVIQEEKLPEAAKVSGAPIVIDIEKVSQSIGISTEDYNTFLNEYIDTALSLEEDLQSPQEEKRSNAISTLSHLSNVLQLPVITDLVTQIERATAENQSRHIESFYTSLSRLSTSKPKAEQESISPLPKVEPEKEEPKEIKKEVKELSQPAPEVLTQPEKKPEPKPEAEPTAPKSFGSINLDDVKSIHFDFQIEQAANDLSLPIELIEEFVNDFILQAHEETKKMLEAYEKGELETIQKIGHLLKGTSSNLRIDPLADTLYEIQFCEDANKLEKLIKNYWGHFLSLETQINLKSK